MVILSPAISMIERGLGEGETALTPVSVGIGPHTLVSAGIGILAPVLLQKGAIDCMYAIHALKRVSLGNSTRRPRMIILGAMTGGSQEGSRSSRSSSSSSSSSSLPGSAFCSGSVKWDTSDFIKALLAVKASGKFNYEGCRIPIPPKSGTIGTRRPWGTKFLLRITVF